MGQCSTENVAALLGGCVSAEQGANQSIYRICPQIAIGLRDFYPAPSQVVKLTHKRNRRRLAIAMEIERTRYSETSIIDPVGSQCGKGDTSPEINGTTGVGHTRQGGSHPAEKNGRPGEEHRHNAQRKGKTSFFSLVLIADECSHPIKCRRNRCKEDLAATRCDGAEFDPEKCLVPGCDRSFKRICELRKHEKTHSRPWKCPVSTCKYHEYGLPTEAEMARHHNDKHVASPSMFECVFKPCRYKSKRESNCKQHMEKAHGWIYVRKKCNSKTSVVF